jgi:UDP-N-acetylmuramyl pentapeptide phosphotransferase/UDP-N-acetylglucosamine-1-phosphate transferase
VDEFTGRVAATVIGVAAVSWLSVGALTRYALTRGVLDTPKERSSHVAPTPRGGGAGLVASAIAGFLFAAPAGAIDLPVALALLGVLPTAVAGWIDDHGSLPIIPRLAAHVASALLLLPLAIGFGFPAWIVVLLALGWMFATVSAINVVNFIDGIDGLIGLQAVVFGFHLAVLAEGGSAARVYGVILAAASAAFLAWNWAPARVFLGDVGSGSVAVLGLIGGILVWRAGSWSFIAVFLPLFPIFLDASVAIVRRLRRNEPVTVAHRSHLYQRLANERRWGHAKVSLLYGATAATATIALMSVKSKWLVTACIAYMGGVVLLGWLLERPERRARRIRESKQNTF